VRDVWDANPRPAKSYIAAWDDLTGRFVTASRVAPIKPWRYDTEVAMGMDTANSLHTSA